MKRFLLLAFLLFPTATYANPFQYKTGCYLETPETWIPDICTVVETRESNGALRTRNIYSNRWGLTIKSWFDKKQGFMTWDSYNKFSYKWEYKVGYVNGSTASIVMPGVYLENVSWD